MEYRNSGEPGPSRPPLTEETRKKQSLPFKVLCEPIGEFSKFETVVKMGEPHFAPKSRPSTAPESRPTTCNTDYAERDVVGFIEHAQDWNVKKYPKHEQVTLRYDVEYRMEHPEEKEYMEKDAHVTWTRKDLKRGGDTPLYDPDSETEPETAKFIMELEKKKATGWVTDETLYYDMDDSMIRNLHTYSISLTAHAKGPHQDFGNPTALYPIMTSEEKLMVGAPQARPGELAFGSGKYRPAPSEPYKHKYVRTQEYIPDADRPFELWSDRKYQHIKTTHRFDATVISELANDRPIPNGGRKEVRDTYEAWEYEEEYLDQGKNEARDGSFPQMDDLRQPLNDIVLPQLKPRRLADVIKRRAELRAARAKTPMNPGQSAAFLLDQGDHADTESNGDTEDNEETGKRFSKANRNWRYFAKPAKYPVHPNSARGELAAKPAPNFVIPSGDGKSTGLKWEEILRKYSGA